ncbi:MAG: APC family permease [Candidatus Thermoplasmatota archaeon]|jgi:amino acid transporter|nr:APC family permease [Candidatus Thermoplasmatota archaeon]
MSPNLKRSLKFTRLIAVTMGTPLAASVFLSIIIMETYTTNLPSMLLAVVISTVLAATAALSYGELASIYPSAAGNRVFLKKPMGNVISVTLSFMWTIIILGAAGVEAYVLGNVLHFLLPFLPSILWSVISLTVIVIINAVGVEVSGNFQMGVTFFIALSLVAISVVALATPHQAVNTGGSINIVNSFTAAAVGVYFFLGFGRVTTLGEEAIDFKRGIPRAMPIAIVLLGVIFLFVSSAIFTRVPIALVASSPVPQIVLGKYMLNRNFAIVVAFVSAVMSFGTFNAGILGTSRLIYALGREGTLPSFLGRINSRFYTPTASLIFLYVIALVISVLVYATRSFQVPVLIAALFDSFMYAFVAYSAFWHHRRLKGSEIPFRIRGGTIIFLLTAMIFVVLAVLLILTSPATVTILTVLGILISGLYFFFKLRSK